MRVQKCNYRLQLTAIKPETAAKP